MRALDRKLLRDLALMWSQVLTIALVVASGLGGFIATLSAVDSLDVARERFYAQGRFADVFASMKRAPLTLLPAIQALPGVAHAQATVEVMVRVQLPGVVDPIGGQIIGLDRRRPNAVNLLTLRSGRADDASMSPGPAPSDGALPAWVSEAFAQARGLRHGDRLLAIVKRPDVLLCDESTGALHYPTGRLVLEVIERVNRELGTTVVVITHNAAIAGMDDRVIRLSDGGVQQVQANAAKVAPRDISW